MIASRRKLGSHGFAKACDQISGLFVAMSLGQRGEARDVGEQERGVHARPMLTKPA
jgi:hypothetical protein